MFVDTARKHLKASMGFTLVEVLIALLLIGLLLVPAMSAIASLLGGTAKRDIKAQALDLARSTVETMKVLSADAFSEGTAITTVTNSDGSPPFDVERVLRPYDEDSRNTLWEVTVSVYEHPMSDNPSPLCSLTTLLFPQ